MTVEMLNNIAMAVYIAAGVVFLVAVALFFLLDIPKVVGELSGSTAKKSIQKIQEHNKNNSGNLVHSNNPNSHVTKPSKTGRVGVGTEKFSTSALESSSNETTLLVNKEPENPAANETTVLKQDIANAPVVSPSVQSQPVTQEGFEEVESLASYMENELIE